METAHYYKNIFLTFIYLKSIWIFLLNILNYNKITKRQEIPLLARKYISKTDNEKAIRYNSCRLKWDSPIYVFNIFILIIWTLLGGLDLLDFYLQSFTNHFFTNSLLFISVFFLINYFLSVPIQLFNIFYIEKKFGFNKTTLPLFLVDQLKAISLSIVIGIPILSAIILFLNKFPANWWIYTFIFLTLFQLILTWLYPNFIAPIFNKFSPIQDLELKSKIENLLKKSNFNSSGVFVMDASKRSKHSNAYFTGFGKSKKIVLFDTLVNDLTHNELLAVLAHELGHFKKKHIIKGLFFSIFFSFFSFYVLNFLLNQPTFFLAHDLQHITMIKGIILYFLVFDIYTFWSAPLHNYFSRKYEFEADQYAKENSSASDLISALFKLQKENAGVLSPHYLYTLNYYSHPTVIKRAEVLLKLSS